MFCLGHHYEDTDDSSSASEMEMPVRVPKTGTIASLVHSDSCKQAHIVITFCLSRSFAYPLSYKCAHAETI